MSKSSSFHLCCLSPGLPPSPPIPDETVSLLSVLEADDEAEEVVEVGCDDDAGLEPDSGSGLDPDPSCEDVRGLEPEPCCVDGSGLDPEPGLLGWLDTEEGLLAESGF